MALTGVVLIGFVVGHLVGNLQIFQDPDHINGYAEFLHTMGPMLWVARIVIIAAVLLHVWAAVTLSIENYKARGNERYAVKHTIRATLASRLMKQTGLVVLAFLIYHIAHFTLGYAQQENFKDNLNTYVLETDYKVAGFTVVKEGTEVLDVHSMVVLGFQNVWVSAFYIIAVGLLSYHLLHGFDSMFQTFGWRSGRWSPALRKLTIMFCLAYFLGNLAIPASILAGKVQLHEGFTREAFEEEVIFQGDLDELGGEESDQPAEIDAAAETDPSAETDAPTETEDAPSNRN